MADSLTTYGPGGASFTSWFYGSLNNAIAYFEQRLHSKGFKSASQTDRQKALSMATQIVDSLNFTGSKTTEDQPLEFPRCGLTSEPIDIQVATYEIADSILKGDIAETKLEELGITSAGYSSVRMTYNRSNTPLDHYMNGVPNYSAWLRLKPYLRDQDHIRLNRVT